MVTRTLPFPNASRDTAQLRTCGLLDLARAVGGARSAAQAPAIGFEFLRYYPL